MTQPNALPTLWIVIPVKPFREGKSRLAAALDGDERAVLSRRWFTHVLTSVRAWGRAAGVLVISRDPGVLALGRDLGAQSVTERGDALNPALEQARAVVLDAGGEALLVLPSDLPLLALDDLDELYDLMLEGPGVVLAPSHDGGTNALLLRPPQALPFAFGEASFARHTALAAVADLPCRVYHSVTLALDIDYPEDLLVIPEMGRR